MKPRSLLASSVVAFGLATLICAASMAQQIGAPGGIISPEAAAVLSPGEVRWFEDRIQSASSEEERSQIRSDLDGLVAERSRRDGAGVVIPPSSQESEEDLIMPSVPTPQGGRGVSGQTPERGGMAPTGSGARPAFGEGDVFPR